MRRLAPLLALALLAQPAPRAAAEPVYRWTDERGNIHFTQHLDQVPPHQRAAARTAASAPGSDRLQTYESAQRISRSSSRGGVHVPFERYGTLMKVDVVLNDALTVPCYVDTGASDVSLPRHVVEKLGIFIGPDTPRAFVATANGVVQEPVVRLDSVELGGARVEGLDAIVSSTLPVGLLGGTFFNNFVYRVDAAESLITLVPNQGIRGGLSAEDWRHRFAALRDPLAELERYLEEREVSRANRRAVLEQRRAQLERELQALEREADRAEVPASWRR